MVRIEPHQTVLISPLDCLKTPCLNILKGMGLDLVSLIYSPLVEIQLVLPYLLFIQVVFQGSQNLVK